MGAVGADKGVKGLNYLRGGNELTADQQQRKQAGL
jgi:hypothetical protein